MSKLHTLLFGSLRRQVTFGVACVVALTMLLFGWDLHGRQRELLQERQHDSSLGLAKALAESSQAAVAAGDGPALQRLVAAQMHLPQLAFAVLLDPAGRSLAEASRLQGATLPRGVPSGSAPPASVCDEDLCSAVAPIRLGSEVLGWARVGIGRKLATSRLDEIMRMGLVYAFCAALASTAMAALVATRSRRRLARIQRVADAVERGNLAERVALGGTDEAAQLARTFDHMLDSLAASRAALTESEQRLLVALDAASMVAWHWDIAKDKTDWGDKKQTLLGPMPAGGYPDFRTMVIEEDREAYLAVGRAAMAGNPEYVVEFRLRRTDGVVRWMVTSGRVIRDPQGKAIAMTGVTQDVTDRKTAQQTLQRAEAAWTEAMNQFDDVLYVVDRERRLVRANQAFCRMVGGEPAALLGRPVAELIHPHGETRACPVCAAQQAPRDANFVLEADDPANHAGRPMSVRVRVIRGAEGEATACLTAMHDLTAERAVAAELMAHRNHLEELVAERTADLLAARNEAERLARVKSDFLANMSHEIRTPLSAVLGLAEIGLRGSAGRASSETFDLIRDSGQHLLGVINDILDFSRLDAGKFTIDRLPFELQPALARAGAVVAQGLRSKGLGYELSLAPDLPAWVVGDAQRLQQILVNLLANAVKFTERGGVELRVSGAGGRLEFEVIDSGIGMDADQIARLFQPFEQADGSTTRRYGGSGLGLAISRNLAHLMGGDIHVTSTPGRGSRFCLRLPLAAAPQLPARPAGPSVVPGPRLAGLRLLAAEDFDVNRMILEAFLVHEGAQVVFAVDGQQVLDRLAEVGPDGFDAVLMDVQMPVMDGLEATRRLRAMAPDLPVIGLTAHALADEREKCMAAGMVQHVTKPIEIDVLVAAIVRHARRPTLGKTPIA